MSPDASMPRAEAPGVVALDRLSDALLAAVDGARVEVVATRAELEAVLRLRHDHVLAHGWAPAPALSHGLERDGHDDDALHVAAWDGTELMGAMRVVLPAPGRRLPVEAAFGLDVE